MRNSFPQVEVSLFLATVVTMVITNEHKMNAWTKLLRVCVCAHAHERQCDGKWMIYCFYSVRNSPVLYIMKEIYFSQSFLSSTVTVSRTFQCCTPLSLRLRFSWYATNTEAAKFFMLPLYWREPSWLLQYRDYSRNSDPLASKFYVSFSNWETVCD
jgi:hypothetical protein